MSKKKLVVMDNDILIQTGVKRKGYGIIPKLVMQDRNLTRDAKAIYSYFCSYAGKGDTAFPTVSKICYDLDFKSEDTYRKHLKLLVKYDYIKITYTIKQDGTFSNNIYHIIDEPSPEIPESHPISNINSESDTKKAQNIENTENRESQPSPKISGTVKNRDGKFRGINNNSIFNNNNLLKNNNNTEEKNVVVNLPSENIQELKNEIEKTTGAKISKKGIEKLITQSSIETIREYIDNWDKFNVTNKKNIAGFFIDAVKSAYEIPKEQQSKRPMANFKQREYSDEYYKSLYVKFE
jgi:hypothetical protein